MPCNWIGCWNWRLVSGVTPLEVMIGHIGAQFLVMIVQVALLLVIALLAFKVLLHPSSNNHPSIHPSIHLYIHPSVQSSNFYLHAHPFIYLSIYLSIHSPIHSSIHPPIHPCMHASIHPFHPSLSIKSNCPSTNPLHSFIHPSTTAIHYCSQSIQYNSFIHPSLLSSFQLLFQHSIIFIIPTSISEKHYFYHSNSICSSIRPSNFYLHAHPSIYLSIHPSISVHTSL